MSLTYRSVKGSQLTSDEADANVETLHDMALLAERREVKKITNSNLVSGVYTLQEDDEKKWLELNFTGTASVRIPANTFHPEAEFVGDDIGTVRPTFVAGSGLTLRYGPDELPKPAAKYAMFCIKYKSVTEACLGGKLELL